MSNFVPKGTWEVFSGGPDKNDYWGRWYYEQEEQEELVMFGVNVYIEAIEVTEIEGIQMAANPKWQDDFWNLGRIIHGDGPLETIEIDGKPAVIFITPHCS
jgi:hypothetical protein